MVDRPSPSQQQLSLRLDDPDGRKTPVLPLRLGFRMATDGGRPFDDDERFFEPWWPGAPAYLCRSARHVELRTEYLSDPLATFPDLRDVADRLAADGVIVEGTLLALDAEGRPDARLLRRHLTGATAPGESIEGAFVASDLPFIERRRRLASVLPSSSRCALGQGLVGEGLTLGRAVASLGLDVISARRLDGRWRSGNAGDDWLRLRVAEPPSLPTRPFLVLLEKLPLGE